MGIQLDMEYCEVDYEKKKKTSNDTQEEAAIAICNTGGAFVCVNE